MYKAIVGFMCSIYKYTMTQYYILTHDPQFIDVADWITENDIRYEMHLNRTRFWVPAGLRTTEFLLKFIHCCPTVEE